MTRGLSLLTGGRLDTISTLGYAAVIGRAGSVPTGVYAGSRPFRVVTTVDGVRVEVRMESWLPFDTMRRMGLGHVVGNRHHALVVERGVSFVALDGTGNPIRTA